MIKRKIPGEINNDTQMQNTSHFRSAWGLGLEEDTVSHRLCARSPDVSTVVQCIAEGAFNATHRL